MGEWWDTGKARVKDLLISGGKKLSAAVKQRRACLLNKFRRLHVQSVLSDREVAELDDIKTQLADLEFRRIRGNRIRSKAKWIETNEQPSKFFFQKERKRIVKKTCHALRTSDGRRVTSQTEIAREQVRFYTELYSAVPTDRVVQNRLLGLLENKLSDDQRDSCEHPLLESECLAALKTMSNGKTPGSDGLPKEFFMAFWDDLKDDFVEMVNFKVVHHKGKLFF